MMVALGPPGLAKTVTEVLDAVVQWLLITLVSCRTVLNFSMSPGQDTRECLSLEPGPPTLRPVVQ